MKHGTMHHKPTALHLKLAQGVDKNSLRFIVSNCFVIPNDYLDLFEKYYLLYWRGKHLKDSLRDGILKHSVTGTSYTVSYIGCTPEQAFSSEQVRLSFRKPYDYVGIAPHVLIQLRKD